MLGTGEAEVEYATVDVNRELPDSLVLARCELIAFALNAVAGYPAITVPMGYVRGLPLGLTFMGRAWSEATLLKLAYVFEQASKVRRPPTFAESAELQ